MNSVRELLLTTVELLDEDEAHQTLKFVQVFLEKREVSLTLKRLAGDANFKIPPGGIGKFPVVQPLQGKGVAASRRLLEDRR